MYKFGMAAIMFLISTEYCSNENFVTFDFKIIDRDIILCDQYIFILAAGSLIA